MYGEVEVSSCRALVREWARLGNLLSDLTHSVNRGFLAGDPLDTFSVLLVLGRIEQQLTQLTYAHGAAISNGRPRPVAPAEEATKAHCPVSRPAREAAQAHQQTLSMSGTRGPSR